MILVGTDKSIKLYKLDDKEESGTLVSDIPLNAIDKLYDVIVDMSPLGIDEDSDADQCITD